MVEDEDTGLSGGKDIPPWLQPVPDDEPELSFWQSKRTVIISASVAVILLGVFIAALVVLYEDTDDEAPRRIAAPEGPVREKPLERGGMDIKHQDKKIFDQIDGEQATTDRVVLAEQPEQPGEIPADEAASEQDVVSSVLADMKQSAPETDSNPVAKLKPLPKPESKPQPKSEPKSVAVAEKPTSVSAAPAYRVQLGAYSSEKAAATAWKTIKVKYSRQLDGTTPFYEAVNSGDRTLYRLRVGPLATRAEADQVCLGLRAGGQACIVVNP